MKGMTGYFAPGDTLAHFRPCSAYQSLYPCEIRTVEEP
jgi:hypothetical protein